MTFCNVCDSRLINKKCPKCDRNIHIEPTITLDINKFRNNSSQVTVTTPSKKELIETICKKGCGGNQAYITKHQLRAGDEGETLIYTCVNCNKTWRV